MENVFCWESYATYGDYKDNKTTGWKIINRLNGKSSKLYTDFDKMSRDLKQANMLMKRALRRIDAQI